MCPLTFALTRRPKPGSLCPGTTPPVPAPLTPWGELQLYHTPSSLSNPDAPLSLYLARPQPTPHPRFNGSSRTPQGAMPVSQAQVLSLSQPHITAKFDTH